MGRRPDGAPVGAALRRALGCAVLALAVLPVGAGEAAADGEEHRRPADDLPRLVAVEPDVPGMALTVIEGGLRLRLDNDTGVSIDVSPAGAARGAEPVVAPGRSAAWSDPRLDAPTWSLPLRVGDVAVTVSGDRFRPPPPDPVPWWALTASAALFTFALGAAAAERGRRSRAALAVAGVTVLVVTAHVVHVLGAALVLAAPPGITTTLAAAGPGVACWALGILGAVLTALRHPLGTTTCATAGGLAALLTVFDAAAFHRAVLEFGWAYDLDRATTVLTLGCGAGLLLTGFAVLGRSERAAPTTPGAGAYR